MPDRVYGDPIAINFVSTVGAMGCVYAMTRIWGLEPAALAAIAATLTFVAGMTHPAARR